MEEQTKLFLLNNQNLFSNNYLERRLPNTDLWKEQKEKVSDVFDVIKKAYDETKTLKLGPGEEAGLEDKFIRPVLKALGYEWDVQPTTKRGLKKKRPDYALFKDKASLTDARKDKDNLVRFFKHPVTILEAKYWGRRLNDADPKDTLDKRDPTAQTVKYLDDVYHASESRIQWAILTNGKHWRLFYYKAASRSGNFFEIDLEEIITREDKKIFLYFYLFFSRDAFVVDPASGKTWLDQHLKGTEDYAARISTKLKDLIFDKVFEGLAEGFVHYRKDNPPIPPLAKGGEGGFWKETDESKKDIFRGCLTLLYRLLFVLYAESRNLLPVNEDAYYRVSLSKLKRDINSDISGTGLDKMSKRSYTYWARLQGLFDIIAKGDPALNVPVYNGGLFETPNDGFLSIHKLPDPFLADAIELLTVDHEGLHAPDAPAFIDYSSLSVRHLGDIYEGILEFHIQVAEEDVVEIRKDRKSLWEKASAIKEGIRIYGERAKGQVYIENSKHERKATGSFYTPHFSVEYIVGNTVRPVLDEKLKIADGLLSQFVAIQKKSLNNQLSADSIRGYRAKIRELEDEIFKTVFGIKVLDPAMGSGHFLVYTVDYISDRIIAFLVGYPDNPIIKKIAEMRNEILGEISKQGVKIDESKLTEVNLIKRMVMKRCIYGVDLNEMAVELAKLSLWLDSFTLGAPLSFLDHHLKCGNSLIGTNIDALEKALTGRLFAINLEPLKRAMRDMIFVSDLPDATVEQVRQSYKKFGEANKGLAGYRILLDMLVSEYFGIPDAKKMLVSDFDKIDLNNLHASIAKLPDKDKKLIDKVEAITREKRFFHWEIEFPEVFYEQMSGYEQKVQMKNNPGFDCVVGNPPYGLDFETAFKKYLGEHFKVSEYQLESFALFIEQAIVLLRQGGLHSYITPTTWLSMHYYENLRSLLLSNNRVNQIIFFKEPVFADATVEACIEIVEKTKPDENAKIMLGIVSGKPENMDIKWSEIEQQKIENFEGKRITEYLTPELIDLFERMNRFCSPLREIASIVVGCKPYQVGKGTPAQTKHTVENRLFDANFQKDKTYKQYLRGEDFSKYSLDPQHSRWVSYGEWLAEPRPSAPFFVPNKIVIRQTADTLIATIDDKQYLNLNNVHNLVLKEKCYSLNFMLSLINSRFLSFIHHVLVPEFGRVFAEVKIVNLEKLPIPSISFTTPEKDRKERVRKAIELYESYMVELEQKGNANEKTEASAEHNRAVGEPVAGGKEGKVSGEHPGAGARIHGVRGRTRKPDDVEGVYEESEEYNPSSRSTRYIESTLGIKSYSELAPYLAKEVERVMASLLEKSPDELKVTPEFICELHKDAFESLFPSWAGRYRDRNVKVGDYEPPPYYEVPVLMRGYCDDIEFRLSSLAVNPPAPAKLIEAFAFAEGRLLSIHPFRDFNGRVTRMLLFSLLCRFDMPPVKLVPDEQDSSETDEYLNALTEADRMDWQPLTAIWRKRLGLEEDK